MEGLTKQQLVLLAILVSFVTSIATGIFTVSLMDQAPKAVVQNINRVVERTVEKVVPSSSSAAVATRETIVVKADDLVVSAIEKNKKQLIKIIKIRDEYGGEKEKFGGLAIPVSKKGLMASSISVLTKEFDSFGSIIPESYEAIFDGGKKVQVVPIGVDETNSVVYFEARTADGKADLGAISEVVTLGNSDGLKLGQSVVAISGATEDVVSTGIISALVEKNAKSQDLKSSSFVSIKTDLKFDEPTIGSTLLNLSGEVVGIMVEKTSGKSNFLPSNFISAGVAKMESGGKTNITL
jgi:S1-C subfamily serine protease